MQLGLKSCRRSQVGLRRGRRGTGDCSASCDVEPVVNGGAVNTDVLRDGNDGLASGEEGDGFQLDRG